MLFNSKFSRNNIEKITSLLLLEELAVLVGLSTINQYSKLRVCYGFIVALTWQYEISEKTSRPVKFI
jgi:hypothetical protein